MEIYINWESKKVYTEKQFVQAREKTFNELKQDLDFITQFLKECEYTLADIFLMDKSEHSRLMDALEMDINDEIDVVYSDFERYILPNDFDDED